MPFASTQLIPNDIYLCHQCTEQSIGSDCNIEGTNAHCPNCGSNWLQNVSITISRKPNSIFCD